MVGAGLRRGVDDRKHAVATCGGGDRLAVLQKFFAAKEGYPGPIDEFSEIFLLVDQGVVVSDQFSNELFSPFRPSRPAFPRFRLRKGWIIHRWRMEFTESVVRVGADVIEKIVRVLSSRIR